MKNLKKSLDYSIGNTVRIFHKILVIKTAKNRIFRIFGGKFGVCTTPLGGFPLKERNISITTKKHNNIHCQSGGLRYAHRRAKRWRGAPAVSRQKV